MKSWRLIIEGRNSASYNMAADAYLLTAADTSDNMPVLRIYQWDRPSITIGYHQSFVRAVDVSLLGTTPVVKRITGGRALFHDDGEITYSVAGNFLDHPELGATLHDSYRRISSAIVTFYNRVGWDADMTRRDNPVSLGSSQGVQKGCFAAVTHYEITVNGHKMAAGSQRRTVKSLMQHGAIKIAAPREHPAILNPASGTAAENAAAISLNRSELAENLAACFATEFECDFAENPFSGDERSDIVRDLGRFPNLNLH